MQRQREGIAKAKGEGNFKGRKRKPDLMPEKIKARLAASETHAQIAKSLKVARSSVYRVVAGPRTKPLGKISLGGSPRPGVAGGVVRKRLTTGVLPVNKRNPPAPTLPVVGNRFIPANKPQATAPGLSAQGLCRGS